MIEEAATAMLASNKPIVRLQQVQAKVQEVVEQVRCAHLPEQLIHILE